MKTIQEQLCDRVYELLPEKKELGFGCEIEALIGDDIMWADIETGKVMYECGMCTKHKRQSSCSSDCDMQDAIGVLFGSEDNGYSIVTMAKSATYKIIGQPLRLADLLLAICKQYKNHPSFITVNAMGQVYEFEEAEEALKAKYDLSQDNLLNQSDELCKLCLGLLNK